MAGMTSLVMGAMPLVTSTVGSYQQQASQQAAAQTSLLQGQAEEQARLRQLEIENQQKQAAQERAWEVQRQMAAEEAARRQAEQDRQWAHEQGIRDTEAQAAAEERTRALSQFRLTQKVELDQLAQDHSADLASADDAGASQMAQIQQSADSEERRRRDALKRAVSRTRASLAGRGLSQDGMGEAVALGLVEDADAERRDAQSLDRGRLQAIQQDLRNRRRRNLLEQAQLAERQRLELLSRFS